MKKIIRLISILTVVASTFFISSNVASAGMISEPGPVDDNVVISVNQYLDDHCYKNGGVVIEITNNNPEWAKGGPQDIWVQAEVQIFASSAGAYSEWFPGPGIAGEDVLLAGGDSVMYVFLPPAGSFHGIVRVWTSPNDYDDFDLAETHRLSVVCDEDGPDTDEGDPEETIEGDPEETIEGDPEETIEGDPEETTEGDPEETTEGDPEEVTETEVDDPVEGAPLFTG